MNASTRTSIVALVTSLFVLFAPQTLQSQSIPHTIIKGRVVDDSTRSPLPLTNVFISNSTIGAAADSQGRFELKGVPLGTQEIIASIVGYAPQTKALRLTDTLVYEVQFRLKPRAVQIEGVEVEAKEPKEWQKNLQRFLEEFLGSTPNAEQCKVLNPEVLDFAIGKDGLFSATARAPLEMENKALGYHVRLFLDHFTVKPDLSTPVPASAGVPPRRYNDWKSYSANGPDPIISKETPTTMELLCRTQFIPLVPVDEKELIRWKENRKRTHYGSERHFLSSLVQGNSKASGFEVQRVSSRWEVDPETLLSPGDLAFEKKLSFESRLQIIYSGGDETQKSTIQLSQPFATVYVNVNGMLADPLSITAYGYWATQQAADILPLDYSPDEIAPPKQEAPIPRASQTIHRTSPDSIAQLADSLFLRGDFISALNLYDSLGNKRNDSRGFLGLGRISLARENWLQARQQIEKAFKLDSNSIDAQYYAAIAYRESGRWRSRSAYQAQGLSQEGAYAKSTECFHWTLQRDSTYKDLLYQYALLLRDQEQYGEAMGALCDEARLKPELPFIYPAIARLYRFAIDAGRGMDLVSQIRPPVEELGLYIRAERLRREGKPDEAEKMLWQFIEHTIKVPAQLGYRALLRIYAARGDMTKLEETYWKAIAVINDDAGDALMFEDLKYILSPQEMADFFRSTLEQKRDQFFSSAWNRRNPTPGSPSNQRLLEHYQRLVYAEQNYSMDRERYSLAYSRGFPGPNFELKDIGLVYMRLGPPNDLTYGTNPSPSRSGDVIPVESWHYHASTSSPEIMLYFYGKDKSFSMMGGMGTGPGDLMEVDDPELTRPGAGGTVHLGDEERALLASLPPELAFWDPNYYFLEHSHGGGSSAASKIVEESARSIAAGLSTERHTASKDVKTFALPFVTSTFRDGEGRDVIEVAYAVPGPSLLKQVSDSVPSMNVESGFAIYDRKWKKVTSVAETLQVLRLNQTPGSFYRFHQTLVKPDTYHVAVYARPLEAALLAKSERSVFAPNYWQAGLGMSDLQLALDISKTDEPTIFDKEGLKVVVNPLAKHVISRPLYVYFEVYNATETPERTANLDLEISLVPAPSNGGVLSSVLGLFASEKKGYYVTSEVERWKSDMALAKYFVMDVKRMQPGEYVLQIKVTDRATKKTVSRSVMFELVSLD